MADVSAMMDDQGARVKYLLLVFSEDPVFGTPGRKSDASRMIFSA
jgi:hypothetical protein